MILSTKLETPVSGYKFLNAVSFSAENQALLGCFNLVPRFANVLKSVITSNSLIIAISQ